MAIVACSQTFYWDDFSCICAPCEAVCESGYVEKEGNQHCMELCPGKEIHVVIMLKVLILV